MLNGAIKVFYQIPFQICDQRSKFFLRKVLEGGDVPYNEETDAIDEVKEYLDSRYICDKDSC
jgi:hypothetical protein